MTNKEITELQATNKITSGDLFLVRKTSLGTDNSINYQNLVESIGSPAINGFIATQVGGADEPIANAILLTPVNSSLITTYKEGMKISFKSPIKSTGVVSIQIGHLTAVDLYRYNTTESVQINIGDYVEAILTDGNFERVNDLKSLAKENVFTNDYIVETHEVTTYTTNLYLVSAYGLQKTEYYNGMNINFRCPVDTQGWTKISIDGLPTIPLSVNTYDELADNNYVATPLFKDTIIQAVYDTTTSYFLLNKFAAPLYNPTVSIKTKSENNIAEQSAKPDPSLCSFSVGFGSQFDYQNLPEAYAAVIKTYGTDGKGFTVTLEVKTNLEWTRNQLILEDNYPWIIIQGIDNKITIVSTLSHPSSVWSNGMPPRFAKNTEITLSIDNPQIPPLFSCPIHGSHKSIRLDDIKIIISQYTGLTCILQIKGNSSTTILHNVQIIVEGSIISGIIAADQIASNSIFITNSFIKWYSHKKVYRTLNMTLCSSFSIVIKNSDLAQNVDPHISNITLGNRSAGNQLTQINSRAKVTFPYDISDGRDPFVGTSFVGQDGAGNHYNRQGSTEIVGTD